MVFVRGGLHVQTGCGRRTILVFLFMSFRFTILYALGGVKVSSCDALVSSYILSVKCTMLFCHSDVVHHVF